MRRIVILLLGVAVTAAAQHKVMLDLDRTVRLATDSSLAAQKYQSVYDASRYQYLSWQASRKPQFALESTPVMYERYMTQRYLSMEDIDVYRQQRMLYSQAGITATQTMERWGGHFYGSTQLGYLRTFGDQNQTQFMTVPITVGYKQELLFYNPLKWAKQIEPLKLQTAEKTLVYGTETASEEAVAKFFTLALAQDQLRMAEEYLASCDTIYAIAQRRFKIASISKAELSILELEKTNARTTLANARISRQRAAQDLATYLGMDRSTDIELVMRALFKWMVQDLVPDPRAGKLRIQRGRLGRRRDLSHQKVVVIDIQRDMVQHMGKRIRVPDLRAVLLVRAERFRKQPSSLDIDVIRTVQEGPAQPVYTRIRRPVAVSDLIADPVALVIRLHSARVGMLMVRGHTRMLMETGRISLLMAARRIRILMPARCIGILLAAGHIGILLAAGHIGLLMTRKRFSLSDGCVRCSLILSDSVHFLLNSPLSCFRSSRGSFWKGSIPRSLPHAFENFSVQTSPSHASGKAFPGRDTSPPPET